MTYFCVLEGENDLPAAGKIDPYDNREKANAEYAVRMSDPERIVRKREEAIGLKEKIMVPVMAAIEKEDWKEVCYDLSIFLIDSQSPTR